MNIFRFSRTYRSTGRLKQIIHVFLKYGFGQVIDQIHLGRYIPFKRRLKVFGVWPSLKSPSVPERLRMAFSELGPTFIKLAQLLSSRPDLITSEFADELKRLQDEVPPFPACEALAIVEAEIGLPVKDIFSRFDEKPAAAASIAQVHRATLLDGSDVVVKIQRPDIREQIESDIGMLSVLAKLIRNYVPESRYFNPVGIVEEFSRTVRKELDFMEEARNCKRFGRNFRDDYGIYVPRVYDEFVTEKVFVMERVEGVKIDNIPAIVHMGLDRKKLAENGVNAYFKQILEDGFFHADPHSGNLLVTPAGAIAFLDFGIMGKVSEELKESIAVVFLSIIEKDFNRLVDRYAEMGIIGEDMDVEVFRKEFKTDLEDLLEPFYEMSIHEINFAKYLDIITRLAIKHNLKTPPELILINKAILIVDNIGRQLDPDFNFFSTAAPYAKKMIAGRLNPSRLVAKTAKDIADAGEAVFFMPRQLGRIMKKVMKDELQIKMYHVNLPEFIRDMDKSSNRISFAMIVSSIILSSAVMHAIGVGPKIFGVSFFAITAFGIAFFLGIWLLVSIIRSGRL